MNEIRTQDALANSGLISLNQSEPYAGPRTFLVSGVARGGTSLLAKLLAMLAVPMGKTADPVVFEDTEIARALTQPDRLLLGGLIHQRNIQHAVWGFKRPGLHNLIAPQELELFRHPFLILTFRDPVAIAQRNVISTMSRVGESLRAAAHELARLTEFAQQARSPTLLISYEKALTMPARLVDALIAFGGWSVDENLRARMVAAVTVDNPIYWRTARLELKGIIDGVFGNRLQGWCHIAGHAQPVALELLIDDQVVANFRADMYRDDLKKARIGDGRHGFQLDIGRFRPRDDAVVAVRAKGRDFLLSNSGRSFGQLLQRGGGVVRAG